MAGSIGGVVKVTIESIDYGTLPGATLKTGDPTHTTVIASGEHAGTFETPNSSELTATLLLKRGQDYEVLRKMKNGKITFEMDNGFIWQATECNHADMLEFRGEGQGIPVRIVGKPCTQVQAG